MSAMTNEWEPSQALRSNSNASSADTDKDSPETVPTSVAHPKTASADKTISCVSCRKRKLKCDRVKPKCGTCTRLRHECEFPERKRNLGSKRRNMKELEARLAQVETQLVSETKMAANLEPLSAFNTETSWNNINVDMDISLEMGDGGILGDSFSNQNVFGLPSDPLNPMGDYFSQELLALGLQEPLPTQDVMDDLTSVYFETVHKTMPIMHKYRFYASLDRAPHMRPPVCLRYIMWTMAASITEKYSSYEDILYERARRYLQQDEMKGHGEAFVSVYYVQAWALTATYEATRTFFSRSWMSSGRCVRLCHMLSLHRLDGDGTELKRILPVARDWIELEERRRAFWAAFYVDRWASSGTGWPMIIDEQEIMTNLPSSEDAFDNGVMQPSIPLAEALTPEGASKVSPFGGIILSATLFGHNFQHLHKTGPNERPDDLANGEFWKRHRRMDNVLSNTFMFLPDHLRLPAGLRDTNVPLIHMNIHASTICLHQAAILTAEKHKLNNNFKGQCRTRSLMAAEEITNIMRMISHFDVSQLSSWTGFCLYVAAGVLVQDKKFDPSRATSLINLDFLLSAMKALGKRHSITNHFTAQLELDIEAAGIRKPVPMPSGNMSTPHAPLVGNIPERHSMSLADLCSYPHEIPDKSLPTGMGDQEKYYKITTPLTVLPASCRDGTDPDDHKIWNWERGPCCASLSRHNQPQLSQNNPANFQSDSTSTSSSGPQSNSHLQSNSNTPSDSSTPSSMQYPIRQNQAAMDSGTTKSLQEYLFTTASFNTPAELIPNNPTPHHFVYGQKQGDSLNNFLEDQMWEMNGEG